MRKSGESDQGRALQAPVAAGAVVDGSPGESMPDEVVDQQAPAPSSYSTGLLDDRQAAAVTGWSARLKLDKPLPGVARVGPELRAMGLDDRPVASLSVVVAAVVEDLLVAQTPTPLEVALYALAIKEARRGGGRPVHRARGFTLPAELAGTYDALLTEASSCIHDLLAGLWAHARREYPGHAAADRAEQYLWVARQLHQQGLPAGLLTERGVGAIPAGTVAKMGIDRLRRRAVDKVVAMGTSFAAQWLEQPHRIRTDLLKE